MKHTIQTIRQILANHTVNHTLQKHTNPARQTAKAAGKAFLALSLTLALSAGCLSSPVQATPSYQKAVMRIGSAYGKTLNKKQNMAYSPYGLSAALSVLTNGIEESHPNSQKLLTLLGATSTEDLNSQNKAFTDQALYGSDNTFKTANLLLIDKTVGGGKIKEAYKTAVEASYPMTVRPADFKKNLAGEKAAIKKMVNDTTNGFLPDYESIADEKTDVDLLNVTYFKGKWMYPFEKSETKDKKFKNVKGEPSIVPMMHQEYDQQLRYYADKNFRAVSIPYSIKTEDNSMPKSRVEMVVILPKKKSSKTCVKSWFAKNDKYREKFLKKLDKADTYNHVSLYLPRFELDETVDLSPVMDKLGVSSLFSGASGITKIVDPPLELTDASQRTKIKVDEEGTEAAAVTEMVAKCTSVRPTRKIPLYKFNCNVPFVFMLRDSTGMVLFAGAVNQLK